MMKEIILFTLINVSVSTHYIDGLKHVVKKKLIANQSSCKRNRVPHTKKRITKSKTE